MKIDVYAIANTALNSDELVGYSFNVVMSHDDGKKNVLGSYGVTKKDKIDGGIDYEDEEGKVSLNRIKDIIIKSGLDGIVDGAMPPENYFWSTKISFPKSVDLTGAFDRAESLFESDKVIRISHDDYLTMMDFSDRLDEEEELETYSFDGIYGSDEYDLDELLYGDQDESNIG